MTAYDSHGLRLLYKLQLEGDQGFCERAVSLPLSANKSQSQRILSLKIENAWQTMIRESAYSNTVDLPPHATF